MEFASCEGAWFDRLPGVFSRRPVRSAGSIRERRTDERRLSHPVVHFIHVNMHDAPTGS